MFSYSVKRNKVFSVVAVWIMLLATAVFVSPGFAGAIAENPEDFAIVSDGNGGVKITGLSDKGKDAAKDGAVKIPSKVNDKPVTEIGNRAFRESGLNSVEFGGTLKNIGEGAFQGNDIDKIDVKAKTIGQSAFAQNSLKTVVLAGVVNIGSDAFRDNKINDLDFGDKLKEIGSSAFLNNDLDNVKFPESIEKIGDTSFTLNKLREVDIPDGVTELGDNVFSRNGSWVKLVTESKAAKTAKYDSGFGQVLNPVTIRVSFVDDKGKEIQPPKTYGDDLEDKNNVFGRGEKSSFEALKLGDYDFVSAEVNGKKTTSSTVEFTPDKDGFEIKLTYKEVNRKPVLSGVDGKSFKSGDTIDKAALLKGVTAKDYKGANITDKIEVSPSSIPSDASGKYEVTYSVTDSEGRTTTSTATIVVGIDWGKLEVGGGWLVEDFTYKGDTVTGFSSSGRKKFDSGNTKVFMPTHSTDGRVVTRVGSSAFRGKMENGAIDSWGNITKIDSFAFSSNQITALPDSWRNVTTIGGSAFENNQITTLPDSWGNVTTIGGSAFENNQITTLPDSWGNVTEIGIYAFQNNQITTLPDSWGKVTEIAQWSFQNNQITTLPDSWGNVTTIGGSAFHNNQITTLPDSWGNVTTIGGPAFSNNQITTLPDSWGNVTEISDFAFSNNQITTLPDSWGNVTTIGSYAFQYNKITTLPDSWGNVTTIGSYAFQYNKITTLPDSWGNVTTIGNSAFYYNQITTLPDSWGNVTAIGDAAFYNNKITTLPGSWGSVTKIDDHVFDGNQITTLPDSWGNVTMIGNFAFRNNKIATLPDSWGNITTIGRSAFEKNQITTLPDSWGNITTIGRSAFEKNQITTLPDSWGDVTEIGRYAFSGNQITTLPESWGNITTIGNSAFSSNKITTRDFTMPSKNLTSDFVKQVGNSDITWKKITITTDDRKNPHDAKDTNNVIINPTEVRLKYVDKATGEEIMKSQVLTQTDDEKDYYPAPIYGYKAPDKITISKSDGQVVERTFLYEKLSDSELSDLTKNSSISIETTRDTDQNKKYHITEKMGAKVKVDRTGFNSTSITNPTIRVSFPDPSVFDIDKVKVSDDYSLKVSNVKKFDTFFEFTLNRTIAGGDSITVPFTVPFKRGVTPEDTPFKVYAELVDGGKTVALSNASEFVGFYHDPSERMTTRESKDYNGHVLDYDQTKVGQDSFVADSGDNDLTYDIRFDRLERNVGKYTVTVPLPTYDVHPKSKTFRELSDKGTLLPRNKALAVFDPKDNPGWKLDGTNLVYVGDAENKQNIPVPRLSLRYPGAVENSVIAVNSTATLVPYDKPDTENVMMTSASTSNFFYKLVPDGEVFAKNATYPQYRGVTFYDNTRSKNEVFGWSLVFNANKHGLTNMEFMDRDLDSRMYYTSVVAPNGVGKFTVTAYDKDGASLSTTVLDSGERMDFPEHYAREIAKVSIRANDRIAPGKYGSIRLETKLRNPSEVRYDATAGSKKNTFLNYVDFTSDEVNGTSYSFKAMQAKDQTITATKSSSFHGDTITGDDGNYSVGFYAAPGFGETMRNFVQLDLVPEGVGVTGYAMSDKFAKLPGARVEAIDNYKNTGRTAIIWRANEVPYDAVTPESVFNVGTVGINIDITRQDGDMRNEVFVKADGTELDNKITSPDPAYPFLDTGVWSRAGVTDGVKAGESMQQRKQIRKYDADGKPGLWLDGIETTPGEKFDYRLRVMNGTDRPRNNVAMYDVLPYVGDHGLDESSANRESKFANTVDTTRKPTVPKGMKIQYYNSNSPVPEYNLNNADDVLSKLNWSDTPSANTKAIRVVPVSTMTLDARSSLEVILPMKANNETSSPGQPIPANLNQKAWNSFYEKDSVQTRLIEGNRVYNTMVGTPVTVKFNKVTKSGNSTTPVEGAIFSYQRADGTTVATVKSGADGVVEFHDISPQPGDTIVETSAPKGFLKSNETRVITAETLSKLGNSKLITLGDFYNDVPVIPTPPPAGNLTFNKVDVNGKPLANVTFQLKRTVTEKDATGNTTTFDQVFEAKSNAEGKVLFRNVAAGSGYTLSEVKAPGHLKEITPISSITIKDKETATLPNTTNNTVKNDTVKLSITKLGVNDDKLTNDDGSQKKFGQFQAIDGTKLSGAKLDIVEVSSGKTITSVTSRNDGAVYASNLKPNTLYRIVESTKPAGYESIPNFPMEFKVDANGRLTDSKGKEFPTQSSLFVPNRQEEKFSIVTLNKTDGNDAPLPGAEFILEKENADGSWSTYKGSSQKNPLSSDSNGVISWDHLSGGKYRIRETSAPQGYAISKRMIEFAVSKYQDKTFTFKAQNNKITPRINKVEYLARSLDKDSAEFVKAKAEDNANVRLVQSGNTYDVVRSLPNARFTISKTADGKPFETVTSDKDGIATIKTALDENETYYIREVSAPEGYTGKTEPMAFSPRTFTVKDGFDGTIDVFFNNSKKTGTLVVSKLNSATGSPLTGDKTATFTVKSKSDPNFVKTITTDSKTGTAVLDKLPFGEYTIQETAAPDGFILDKTVSPFTVSDENPAYTHIMGNDPQNPSVDIVKKINGYDANSSLSAVMLNANDSKMTVTMDVTNNGNTPLENVTITDVIHNSKTQQINDLLKNATVITKNNDNAKLGTTSGEAINGKFTLIPGATAHISLTVDAPNPNTLHTDTAKVTGSYNGSTVTDDDPANAYKIDTAFPLPATGAQGLVTLGISALILIAGAVYMSRRRA